ncbi:MAG: peroxidase, partial [Verrucomicrobiota bacterium]|nr:peroxidase [Verrucomicrobiota bacterium]
MKQESVDFADVQGLLRFGYGKMKEASYALLRVENADAVRAWLRSTPVTNAVAMNPAPSTALQIAFTVDGLRALGISPSVLGGFSPEFLVGMTEESRARRLGDIDANAPAHWDWGNAGWVPDLVVMFFAEPGGLAPFVDEHTGKTFSDAFTEMRWLKTANLDGIEPFGFTDGISQPRIDWARERDPTQPQIDYSNIVALGEFLLGYPNEYN